MKKIIVAALALVALSAAPALADGAIGVVNVPKIMQESKAAVSLRNQLQAKQKSFQAETDAKQKELNAENQDLIKQKDKVDKDAFDKKVAAFQQKITDAQRQVADKKASIDKAFAPAFDDIQKNLLEITKQVAYEKKMPLVVNSLQVLYTDQANDITDEVMKRLDAKLPSVTVKF